jgi:predicted dinucleotide-binding enzyme
MSEVSKNAYDRCNVGFNGVVNRAMRERSFPMGPHRLREPAECHCTPRHDLAQSARVFTRDARALVDVRRNTGGALITSCRGLSNMRISICSRGPIAEPLARLAERAGHEVRWSDTDAVPSDARHEADLVIAAFYNAEVETVIASILPMVSRDVVVVDASASEDKEGHGGADGMTTSGTERIAAAIPCARIVRAFASVPVEALATVLNGQTSGEAARLAIPLAGDDREAKTLVAQLMREMGVEPFDLGALGAATVLDPGGALWRKALSQVEMLEAVGFLSGDG